MKFLRNKWIQKISAAVLLALFIFIHVVKTFHTHEYSTALLSKPTGKNACVLKTNFSCPICDFQLAKDGDTHISVLQIVCPVSFISSYYHYELPQSISFSIVFSVRGPPSFI